MVKIKRRPTSPGEILNEEFLKPLDLTQKALADHISCDVKVINRPYQWKDRFDGNNGTKVGCYIRYNSGILAECTKSH